MIPLYTKENIYNIDSDYVNNAKVPALQLMETAGTNAAHVVQTLLPSEAGCRILIACGGGNNGGDGLVMARLLSDVHQVEILFDAAQSTIAESTRENFIRLPKNVICHPTNTVSQLAAKEFDAIVDALVGVGGSHELRSPASEITRALNDMRGVKIAVDVPTGLNANSGQCSEHSFMADHTVTMVGAKPGMIIGKGKRCCGELHTVEIGTHSEIELRNCVGNILETSDIRRILPSRTEYSSKFSFGRVGVIGGTLSMRGAPSLTAHAALASGAGLVEMCCPAVHPLTPREVITHECSATPDGTIDASNEVFLHAMCERCTTIAVGPGLARNIETTDLITRIVQRILDSQTTKPVVLDADGLLCFHQLRGLMYEVILTPHVGEFSRLTGKAAMDIEQDPIGSAIAFAKRHGCVVHLKGPISVTTNGKEFFLTTNGNAGLSKAGSGDVLTGIISGLLAQGVPVLLATAVASFLHAQTASEYAKTQPLETMMPSDIISGLSTVIPL